MNDGKYHPPESNLKRLEIRSPLTQGRRAWGYISNDRKLIMSDDGDVWVRHSPEDVFGSKEAAREFAKEQKFRPSPTFHPALFMAGSMNSFWFWSSFTPSRRPI